MEIIRKKARNPTNNLNSYNIFLITFRFKTNITMEMSEYDQSKVWGCSYILLRGNIEP